MDDPTRAKELVTKLVLATDMGVHAANLQKLQTTRQGTKTVANNEHIDVDKD